MPNYHRIDTENLPKQLARLVDPVRGVGKRMGGQTYLHKSAAERVFPSAFYEAILAMAPKGFAFDVVRVDRTFTNVVVVQVKDFDLEDEPTLLAYWSMNLLQGIHKNRSIKGPNPFIYHHKWAMVLPDYQGFDRAAAIERSIKILQLPKEPGFSSRIGRKLYWDAHCVPLLNGGNSTQCRLTERNSA